MKKFNASDLSKKPAELFKAAREDGAIIQHKDRQGNVVEEFVLVGAKNYFNISDDVSIYTEADDGGIDGGPILFTTSD